MFAISVAILFLAATSGFAARGILPLEVPVVCLVASLATAIAYRIDKSAAQTGEWRTSESTLHLLALIGGWPGALVAQTVFHHKSRKLSFRFIFFVTIAVNLGLLATFVLRYSR